MEEVERVRIEVEEVEKTGEKTGVDEKGVIVGGGVGDVEEAEEGLVLGLRLGFELELFRLLGNCRCYEAGGRGGPVTGS